MLDGADMTERTPLARRSLMIGTLTVWAFGVVGAAAAIDTFPRGIVTLIVFPFLVLLTLVVGAALAIDRYPRIATFFAATVTGSVTLVLFLTLVVLAYSATEESDPDQGLKLIIIAVILPVFALAVLGGSQTHQARSGCRDARRGAWRRRALRRTLGP